MEYLTLLNYLYAISFVQRKRIMEQSLGLGQNLKHFQRKLTLLHTVKTSEGHKESSAFFLSGNLTLLNRLFTLKHHHSAH